MTLFEGTPLLCVVLDANGFGERPGERARALFASGADWIQLRDRALPDAPLLEIARALVASRDEARRLAGPEQAARLRVIVNRRADVAVSAGADGVHLGFDALDARSAREIVGPTALIGRSLHSADEVGGAQPHADYAHLAPIWDPNSKPATRPALGEEALRTAAAMGCPVFAQGGVDPARAALAVRAGAAGVAVTGALGRGVEPAPLLREIRKNIDKST